MDQPQSTAGVDMTLDIGQRTRLRDVDVLDLQPVQVSSQHDARQTAARDELIRWPSADGQIVGHEIPARLRFRGVIGKQLSPTK